jgi:hypothetical protein
MREITKFTKGSWYINDCGIHWNNPDLKHLEVCYSEIGEVICDTVYTEADANLIAAAPEMYDEIKIEIEELQEFISTLNHMSGDWLYYSSRLDRKEALLAKARGDL